MRRWRGGGNNDGDNGNGNGNGDDNGDNSNNNGNSNLDAFSNLPASSVIVPAAAGDGNAVLTITVAGATLQPFARSGFRSDGGEMATISLVSDPVDIFTFDNAVVSLTITLSDSRRTIAATVRFVSAPRVITADLLPIPVAAMDAVAGATILAAGAAEISIWHNGAAAIEEYEISPDDGNFGVDSATGLVTATTDLTPDATYDLALHLIDRGLSLTASRSLEAVVGALPPLGFVDLPASSVVVAAAADMGDAVLTITAAGAALPPFARSGFVSDGGAMATISLASEATVVFDSDNAVASLALTLASGAETATATIRFVSAPRVIAAAPATISVSFIDAVAAERYWRRARRVFRFGTTARRRSRNTRFRRRAVFSAWIRRRVW